MVKGKLERCSTVEAFSICSLYYHRLMFYRLTFLEHHNSWCCNGVFEKKMLRARGVGREVLHSVCRRSLAFVYFHFVCVPLTLSFHPFVYFVSVLQNEHKRQKMRWAEKPSGKYERITPKRWTTVCTTSSTK